MQRHSPAADRNRAPILAVLDRVLPPRGLVLELASGTGQHVVHFAAAHPALVWQPSDPDAASRASIAAYTAAAALPNVRPPLALDAAAEPWPLDDDDRAALVAILAINLVHISPWSVTRALFAGAGARLPPGAVLFLYGPYRIAGATAPSNDAFDADLRRRDPSWGVRELEELTAAAAPCGLALDEAPIALPANNHALIFRRAAPGH